MSSNESDDGDIYRYELGLRIIHPTMLVSEMTDALGFDPDWSWDFGRERFTASGMTMPGIRNFSYWAFSDDIDDERFFLATGLMRLLKLLEECGKDILKIVGTGGEFAIKIGLPGKINIGDGIGWQELKRLVDLRIGFDIEVFPGMRLLEKGVAPEG